MLTKVFYVFFKKTFFCLVGNLGVGRRLLYEGEGERERERRRRRLWAGRDDDDDGLVYFGKRREEEGQTWARTLALTSKTIEEFKYTNKQFCFIIQYGFLCALIGVRNSAKL